MTGEIAGIIAPILFPDYPNDVKRCTKCGEVRPITEFRRRAKGSEKRNPECRLCRNDYDKGRKRKRTPDYTRLDRWLRSKYNLARAQYEAMVSQQRGCCLICGEKPTKRLAVDHNHVTGQVRGLLCGRCNILIGYIENTSPEILANAFRYLKDR